MMQQADQSKLLAFCPWHVSPPVRLFDRFAFVIRRGRFRDGADVVGICGWRMYDPSLWPPFVCIGTPVLLHSVEVDDVD